MGVGRIPTNFQALQARSIIQSNQGRLNGLQQRIATGQNINNVSDNPINLNRLLDLEADSFTDQRYLENIDTAVSELGTADSALSTVNDIVQRALEITTQGASFTYNQDGMDAIADEVDGLINQLVQVANTKHANKFLFGGLQTQTEAFTRTGDDVAFNGTPAAQAFEREVGIAEGVRIPTNVAGDAVFGSVTTGGIPVTVTGGTGLFRTLTALRIDLLSGDQDAVRNRLDELQADQETVLDQQARIGSVTNRVELTRNRLLDRQQVLAQQVSSIQTVNLAQTITDLRFQENILNGSQAVLGRVLNTSLLDFI